MNLQLLEKVRQRILENPRLVDMNTWSKYGDTYGGIGCIAQHTYTVAVLDGYKPIPYEALAIRAMRLLELKDYEPTFLFHAHEWPQQFQYALGLTFPGTPSYAKVVSDFLQFVIDSEGQRAWHAAVPSARPQEERDLVGV